jgi:hypothetical protein
LLVNNYEKLTHDKLAAACRAESARVCPKVRVKDALPIEQSGVSAEYFRYSLQSHFDFVVADKDWNALFAVEFDGPLHDSLDAERRDLIKNELCHRFGLPLLRVNANHLQRRFRQWDLLSYFVETWFLKRAFDDAQAKGTIPVEEDFDPMFVFSDGGEKRWPYWFAAPSQIEIQRLQKAGKIAHFAPSHLIGRDPAGNYRCLAYLKISDDAWAVIRTAMRAQLFDVRTSDVVWQVGIVELRERLDEILDQGAPPHRHTEVEALVRRFEDAYSLCSSGGVLEPPLSTLRHMRAR